MYTYHELWEGMREQKRASEKQLKPKHVTIPLQSLEFLQKSQAKYGIGLALTLPKLYLASWNVLVTGHISSLKEMYLDIFLSCNLSK